MHKKLTIAIQAGGESKRMGSPKALVEFCGHPLICNSLLRLKPFADEVLITTNDRASLAFLCEHLVETGVSFAADDFPKRSALNGLHTALKYAQHEYVSVIAVDMIFPSHILLIAERDALIKQDADVAIPKTKFGYEPFSATYRRSTCLPRIVQALEAGETRAVGIDSWYDGLKVIEFSRARIKQIEPRGGVFRNVNTKAELAEIEQKLQGRNSNERYNKISNACPRSSVDRASVS